MRSTRCRPSSETECECDPPVADCCLERVSDASRSFFRSLPYGFDGVFQPLCEKNPVDNEARSILDVRDLGALLKPAPEPVEDLNALD